MRTTPFRLVSLATIVAVAIAQLALLQSCATVRATPDDDSPRVLINRDRSGLALQGYDPVAYFTESRPVMGSDRFTAQRNGATYHFASAQHRDLFLANPGMYEPAFGGYCAYAASINRLSPISPEQWSITDGRLLLQHNQKATDAWNQDVPGNLVKADHNWPSLVNRNGSPVKLLVNTDSTGLALQGYDPVAYRTLGAPTRGDAQFEAVYDGARYLFASMDNRVTFENDPARYAPAFGGYCGYAASINKISPIDPTKWQIIDDRLVLQHTQEAYDLFNVDAPASLARADRNWPGLVARRGR